MADVKPVLTEEALDQVWSEQGMKTKLERFWTVLVERGLGTMAMPRYVFVNHMHTLLHEYLVEGKVDEHG